MTTELVPPIVLTRRGAYVWCQAAALRAGDAGDKAGQRAAWTAGMPYAVHFTLDELLELGREARHLVDGAPVRPMTEDELRTAKRGTYAHDAKGRTWKKATRLWHSYGVDGDKLDPYLLHRHHGPIYPARETR